MTDTTTINPAQVAQLVLANAAAIEHGVKRVTGPAKLGAAVTADMIGDVTLALLDRRGASYDESRTTPAAFCRMVAWQIALDKVRSMNRGGQFGGAYSGFGNAQLDANNAGDERDERGVRTAAARSTHSTREGAVGGKDERGMAVRVKGASLDFTGGETPAAIAERNDWNAKARAAVAEVLPLLSDDERALWAELAAGEFSAADYAQRNGIATATAHVRANRLRSKVRDMLKAAA